MVALERSGIDGLEIGAKRLPHCVMDNQTVAGRLDERNAGQLIKQIVVGNVGCQRSQQASGYAARQRRRAQSFT